MVAGNKSYFSLGVTRQVPSAAACYGAAVHYKVQTHSQQFLMLFYFDSLLLGVVAAFIITVSAIWDMAVIWGQFGGIVLARHPFSIYLSPVV